jgi:hypothetical protein
MKHRMDTPARIHLQLVRYGSHNLHDLKWTNPFGEKLARWLAMLKVKVLRKQHVSCNSRILAFLPSGCQISFRTCGYVFHFSTSPQLQLEAATAANLVVEESQISCRTCICNFLFSCTALLQLPTRFQLQTLAHTASLTVPLQAVCRSGQKIGLRIAEKR